LYACVKEVFRLWAQPHFATFHQILIIVEALWSQPVLQVGGSRLERGQHSKQGGQSTPSWNAPAVLEIEQLYADAHCHGEALHRMSAFHAFCSEWLSLRSFFGGSQYTSDVIVTIAARIPPSALLSSSRNRCHQLSGRETTFV
jgi:hypothetical protein